MIIKGPWGNPTVRKKVVSSILDKVAPFADGFNKLRLHDAIPFAYIGKTSEKNKKYRLKQHRDLLKKYELKYGPFTILDMMKSPRYTFCADKIHFVYQTLDLDEIYLAEYDLIEHFKKKRPYHVNLAPGGGGAPGSPPYYIYVITQRWVNLGY